LLVEGIAVYISGDMKEIFIGVYIGCFIWPLEQLPGSLVAFIKVHAISGTDGLHELVHIVS
jgi:hypothetical protein